MPTKLDKALKREIAIHGDAYVVTLTPDGFTLVPKGKRKGFQLAWEALVSGEAALATALNASLLASARTRSPRGPSGRRSERR